MSNRVEAWRVQDGPYKSYTGDDYGAFHIPGPNNRTLRVIASSGLIDPDIPCDLVSVSTTGRCPNWPEMCFIKDLFFDEEETVMQLHPPRSQWINNHEYCLHLWRPLDGSIPLPPAIAVGIKVQP